eukprot:gnl/TRDRNA2_/TRDRNA2_48064_c0_seq1.p1 gnl/TRDRNA2_/TRDRNA2_48064_c0~~gnl/TRDRNA2_/TRDRNA2_48064_c0_seq1.p1  ORF type:complete len:459 (+),score=54.32 gnl/TRDRNA2_/TRDRNA2_48064_c0_seq1:119-1495(+)
MVTPTSAELGLLRITAAGVARSESVPINAMMGPVCNKAAATLASSASADNLSMAMPHPYVGGAESAPTPLGFGRAPMSARGRPTVPSDDELDFAWVNWTPDDVGDWVEELIGKPFDLPFRENMVDGPTLIELTDNDLRSLLGVANRLHRQKILGHIRVYQMQCSQPRKPTSHGVYRTPMRSPRAARSPRASPAQDRSLSPGSMSVLSHGGQSSGSMHFQPPSRRAGSEHYTPNSARGCLGDRSRRACSSTNSIHSTPQYTNPYHDATAGLNSLFGLRTPSNSERGSFSRGCKKEAYHEGPGPGAYYMDSIRLKKAAPRATIGNSARDTMEHFLRKGSEVTYPSASESTNMRSMTGLTQGSFGMQRSSSTSGSFARAAKKENRHDGPGPCSYNVQMTERHLERKGPSATIGNSPRNTMEHIVSKGAGAGGFKYLDSASRGKVKGGVIGTASRRTVLQLP